LGREASDVSVATSVVAHLQQRGRVELAALVEEGGVEDGRRQDVGFVEGHLQAKQ
jgi:hypothetical protein